MSTEDRIDLEFEQDEKVIIIEINPQKVQKEFFAQFQLLNRIIVRYLDYSLQSCLEIQYGRNQLLISSQDSRVLLEDQKNCDVQKQIKLNSEQFEYWIWGSQKRNNSSSLFNGISSKQYKCQNISDLNQGKQAKNLVSEIDDLYQQASQIELQQIEYLESNQKFQGGVKFNLGDLIHHSVTIKLNQILKNKQETAQKNGLDPLITYLRLGFSILKVLQGIINAKIYAILSNAKQLMNPIKSLTCNQNDMKWLSPKLNQVHQLNNFYPQTAITLQCYKYSKKTLEKIKQFAYVANQQYKTLIHYQIFKIQNCIIFFKNQLRSILICIQKMIKLFISYKSNKLNII